MAVKNRLTEKINRDPYFSSTLDYYKNVNKVIEAGFFDDGVAINKKSYRDSLNWLTTPLYKIKSSPKISKPVVLLTTGGFMPIHSEHIRMMEIAKQSIELVGRTVIGGYLSLSHDDYVKNKFLNENYISSEKRIYLCEKVVADDPWLMVDPWEARYNKIPLTFTAVTTRLQKYLRKHTLLPVEVVYVFGGDNAAFARAFIAKGTCVCVKRPGYDVVQNRIENEPPIASNKNILFSEMWTKKPGISSREIRTGMINHVPRIIQKDFENWGYSEKKTKNPESLVYFIRDDSSWALSNWIHLVNKKKLERAKDAFLKGLIGQMDRAIEENTSIQILNLKEQLTVVNNLSKNNQIINIDVCTGGDFKLNVSRLFGLSSGQCHLEKVINRPGYLALNNQSKKIPMGNYLLLDDDVATGSTTEFVSQLFPKKIGIKEIKSILEIQVKNKLSRSRIADVVDFRDFIFGSRDGGLVVKLPNGLVCRAPYVLPYVSLSFRAKIMPQEEYRLSQKLWQLNLKFYQQIGKVPLSLTDKYFQRLMTYIGFNKNDDMTSICQWHIKMMAM